MTRPGVRFAAPVASALLAALAAPAPAAARTRAHRSGQEPKRDLDPARWFATRAGLIRVYQERPKPPPKGRKAAPAEGAAPPAGASCEVLESTPREGESPARTRESCTMISGRRAKAPAALTYELRAAGIFLVKLEAEGQKPSALEQLKLPPVRKGRSWSERRGRLWLRRTVRSAGGACKAAGRSFGDCLVLKVAERDGKRTRRTWSETYAAGVGLVEDAQWELIDVKGL